MRDLFEQVARALDADLYYLALFPVLTIPDICGAMESPDGAATRSRYIDWFDRYVAPKYVMGSGSSRFSGQDCYYYRCSLLHQGRADHPKASFVRAIFVEPSPSGFNVHANTMAGALQLDIAQFARDMIDGAHFWLATVECTAEYQSNYPKFLQRYANGIPGHLEGFPVIA